MSEPRAVATGSYAQLSINTYFGSYFDPVATARGSDTIRGDSHINYTQARSAQVCYGVGICDADHKSAKTFSVYDKPMTIETPVFLE